MQRAGVQPAGSLAALGPQYKERLLRELDLAAVVQLAPAPRRSCITAALETMLWQDRLILPEAERAQLVQWVLDETVGFGPLESLLSDPTVTEIMVVCPDQVYCERDGRVLPVPDVRFSDDTHLHRIIDRIIAPVGRRIDESSPLVDARLPDGSRVNAVIPPVALHGPTLTIRKFRPTPWTLDDLLARGAFSPAMAACLRSAVTSRRNMIISGGTGSGKTSLLSALVREIPPGERLVTVEDMAELKLDRAHVVALEGRPPNLEGKGEITVRTLIRNALRMRPDRIIVGEVRGEEAFDMLQAMNTGHPGSMTTLHANNPADALARLEQMVMMAGTRMTLEATREHLASTIQVVVQVQRMADGARKVVAIADVQMADTGQLQARPVFRLHPSGYEEVAR